MKTITFLLLSLIGFVVQGQEMRPIPVRFRTVPQLDGGIRVNVSTKMDLKRVCTFSFTAKNSQNTHREMISGTYSPAQPTIERLGFRIKLKQYAQSDAKAFNTGFFHGPFTDLMYGSRRYNWVAIAPGADMKKAVGVRGDVGYNIGFTIKIQRLVLEPVLGLAISDASGEVLNTCGMSVSIW